MNTFFKGRRGLILNNGLTKNEESFLDPSEFLGIWMVGSFGVSKLQGFGEFSSNLGVEKCICELVDA